MKKSLAFILVLLSVAFSAWAFRWSLLQETDYLHLKNRFDHSQWRIPLSSRIISDEELYVVAGTEIMKGGELFSINPETPPLGKYLYGLGYVWLGNPYWVSYLLFVVLLSTIAVFAQRQFRQIRLTWLMVWWASLSAILVSQIGQTMLDLPQAVFLLMHVGLLSEALTTKQRTWQMFFSLLAGVTLGLFAAVKVPILAPVVLVMAVVFLLGHRSLLGAMTLTLAAAGAYLATFYPYFAASHTVMEWLGTQKWMISFYLSSQTAPTYGMYWVTLLTGWFTDATHPSWLRASEWSFGWPLVVGGALIFLTQIIGQQLNAHQSWQVSFKKLATPQVYLGSLVAAFSLVYTVLPFNARYFVLIFPLALLSIGPWLKKLLSDQRAQAFLVIISVVLAGELVLALRPQPLARLQFFTLDLQRGNAQDAYSYLEPSTTTFSRLDFWENLKTTQLNLQSEKQEVTLSAPFVWPWQNEVNGELALSWQTPIGPITTVSPLTLVRVNNQWRVRWDWATVHPNYNRDSTMLFTPAYPVEGKLLSPDGTILSQPGQELLLKVTPSQLGEREKATALISLATGVRAVELEKSLYVDALPNSPITISPLKPETPATILSQLRSEPGIILEEIPGRSYSPDLKTGITVDTIQVLEKKYASVSGVIGGKIELLTKNTVTQTIQTTLPQAGKDVQLTQSDVLE